MIKRAIVLAVLALTVPVRSAYALPPALVVLSSLVVTEESAVALTAASTLITRAAPYLMLAYRDFLGRTHTARLPLSEEYSINELGIDTSGPAIPETVFPGYSTYRIGEFSSPTWAQPGSEEWKAQCSAGAHPSFSAACAAAGGTLLAQTTCVDSATWNLLSFTACGSGEVVCPPGYSMSGSQCYLSDRRQVKTDGQIDYGRYGTTYNLMPENATDIYRGHAPGVRAADGALALSGVTESYGRVHIEVVPTEDGYTKVIRYENPNPYSEAPKVKRTIVIIQPDSTVESVEESIVPGVLVQEQVDTSAMGNTSRVGINPNPASALYPWISPNLHSAVTAPEVSNNPDPDSVPDPDPFPDPEPNPDPDSSGKIEFPSDYAREPTLQDIRNQLNASVALDDPGIPEVMPDFGDAFNDLLGWSLPAHYSVC